MTPGKHLSTVTDVKSTTTSKDKYFFARIAIFILAVGSAASSFGHFGEVQENATPWMFAGIVLLVIAFLVAIADLASITKRSMAKV